MTNTFKTYNVFSASCKVLSQIDWFGNYYNYNITEQDVQYIGEAKNFEQYSKRIIEFIKDKVLKNISDINTITWNIKSFDETITLHYLIREVSKILEKFIKYKLNKYPYYAYHINKHNINYNKSIIIEIINKNNIIFLAYISIEDFL